MNAQRWRQIKQIYGSVLEREPERRDAFLDEACAGDEILRKEVASLLAQEGGSEGLFDSPALDVAANALARDEAPAADLSGQTLSHYRILEKIGEGGMGVVYRAEDTHLKRAVALKLLPPDRVSDPERKRRFVKEARAASALNHPNIVTIYDIDQAEDIDFIAMECVAGTTLDRRIPRKGMALDEVLGLGIQIAEALSAAHAAGIIHRDLKPSNIMVSDSGQVKILDFGLAKLTQRETAGGMSAEADGASALLTTDDGIVLGTVTYMSPEQAQGKKVDARSDIFSFGAVLYEMVSGQRAFRGESAASTLAAIIRDPPTPLAQITPGVPAKLEAVIDRCLRKEPGRRFQAISDVRVELQETTEAQARSEPEQAATRRRKLLWLTPAAVLAVLLGLGGSWLVWRTKESVPVLRSVPFTTYPGFETCPSFSPDGNEVAFQWNGEKQDNWDIYVKSVGSEKPLRLTYDQAPDSNPCWSPEGGYIAFLRFEDGRFSVYTIPPLGGVERKVYETRYVINDWIAGRYLTCTPDSNGFVVSERESRDGPNALVLVGLDTGEKFRLTSPPANSLGDADPVFSPDGSVLSFVRARNPGFSSSNLYAVDLSRDFRPVGAPKPLTDRIPSSPQNPRGHTWRANGEEIIASLKGGHYTRSFWRILLNAPQDSMLLGSGGEDGIFPTISASARRMVYCKWLISGASIWYLEDSGEPTKRAVPTRMLHSTQQDIKGQVSPDGTKFAFQSNRTGSWEIWTCNSDGSGLLQLTNYGGPVCGSPAWSPDSRWIAYDMQLEGANAEIHLIAREGGQPRRITHHPADDRVPSWSRDGRWIYFYSSRTGCGQVWKTPSRGGEPVQVTHKGGGYAQESWDGRTLFFEKDISSTSRGIYRMPVEGGEEEKFLADARADMFAPAAKGYYFWTRDRALIFLDARTGARRVVAVCDKNPSPRLSVFPDGKRIVYSQIDEDDRGDLYVVEKFH